MANSSYTHVHFDPAANDVTEQPSWSADHTLSSDDVQWLPWVTTIGTAHRRYEGGEEALIVSGTNKFGKIRITGGDFSWVHEIVVPGYERDVPTVEQIEQTVHVMVEAGTNEDAYLPAFSAHRESIGQGTATLMNGTYTVMDCDGSYFAGWDTTVYKVVDTTPGDVHSPIEIAKSYDLKDGLAPEIAASINRLVAVSMTYDGYLAIAMPGIIAILDRDLEHMEYVLLEGEAVDNGISIDENGGIYLVTSKYMRKLVWNGSTLSDDEADGAWKTEYDDVPNPKSLSRGAGNTPALLGYGNDDRLVVLADSGEKIKVVAFWRDEIPADFDQKPGTKSRRIADQLELKIKVPATIEWSPHVFGNGVMMMASAWPDPVYDDDANLALFETVITAGVTREPPVGVEKWSWHPTTRALTSDWVVLDGLQWGLHPVSASSNTVTLTSCNGGVYSLLHLDWDTGDVVARTTLGPEPYFNVMGGLFIPVDEHRTYVTGVFGPVMITRPNR